jgi:hypothetical protein
VADRGCVVVVVVVAALLCFSFPSDLPQPTQLSP